MTSRSVSPSPVVLAEVTRGARVESRHFGHLCVVTAAGETVLSVGDPRHATFARSALKPLQAVAALARGVAEAFQLSDAEVAIMCASHQGEERHRAVVAGLLKKVGAGEEALRCGPHPPLSPAVRHALTCAGQEPTRIHNNCSGKHAGMLALARVLDAPLEGYWTWDHPVQQEVRRVVSLMCDVDADNLDWGVDGCGVPTWSLPLRALALGFARLAGPESLPSAEAAAARRITAAMMSEPFMIRGEGGFDTMVMEALPGKFFCKGGAEGCEGGGVPGRGTGLAVKFEDGATRPVAPVVLSLLQQLDVVAGDLPESLAPLARPAIVNTCGETVGEVRACVGGGNQT